MKAVGPAAEVVDRTNYLDTADTAVKTEDTAVTGDVDDTAAGAGTYLQNKHTYCISIQYESPIKSIIMYLIH